MSALDLSDEKLIHIRLAATSLVGPQVTELKALLKSLLAQKSRSIRIEFQGVQSIDSDAIGMLLFFTHLLKPSGLRIRLSGLPEPLRARLRELALDFLIET